MNGFVVSCEESEVGARSSKAAESKVEVLGQRTHARYELKGSAISRTKSQGQISSRTRAVESEVG